MPLPGGASDKYGNRYEGLWTVHCMVRILEEDYSSIYLEVPGEDSAEFQLRSKDGIVEFHQAKRQNGTDARWRIKELYDNGVLQSFWDCTTIPEQKYVFVSIDSIELLRELVERALKAKNEEQFSNIFLKTNTKFGKAIREISTHFNASVEEIYRRLKQLSIDPVAEVHLRRLVTLGISRFVKGNPSNAVDVLAQFALDKVHVELNRDGIIQHLKERDLWSDSDVSLKTHKLISIPSKPLYFISRSSIIRTITKLLNDENNFILVKGVDGAGKTVLLSQFIEEHSADTFYFFVENDWTSTSTTFLREICEQLQVETNEFNNLKEFSYELLKETFGRLIRDVARLGRQRKKSYYLVVDGLENVKNELGRDSVLDLIQFDFEGIYVLGSTNRDLSIRRKALVHNVDYFTPADTEKYFEGIEFNPSQIQEIFRVSEGLPVYLNQLRREIEDGKTITEVLSNLPVALRGLLDRTWNSQAHEAKELDLLAFIAYSELNFDDELLSKVSKIDLEIVHDILGETQFVEYDTSKEGYTFITEAHRSYIAEKLSSHAPRVIDLLIEYYDSQPYSEVALERLPLLARKKNDSGYIKSLITQEYLEKSFEIKKDISLLRRNIELMVDASADVDHGREIKLLSKYSIFSSIFRTLSEESADKTELEALLSIGEYQRSITLAYEAKSLEDKLELLSVIGRKLKHNNGSLLNNIIDEIERIVADISPTVVLKERAIDIAANLFVVHPQVAIDLLDKISTSKGNYSLDILLLVLSLRLSDDNQSIPEAVQSRIENERLREFVNANSGTIARQSADNAISEADKIKTTSGQLFLLRSWCNDNRTNSDAQKVVKKALDIIYLASPKEYSPSMLHLRQFAEPLLQYKFNEVETVISLLKEIKSSALQQPFEEAIRLDLLIIRIETQHSIPLFYERLVELRKNLVSIPDHDVVCYCYTQLILAITQVDPSDSLGLISEIETELWSKFQSLLDSSAEHFSVTKRIIRALTKFNAHLAVKYSQALNTLERRDWALGEIIEVYEFTDDVDQDLRLLADILELVNAPAYRERLFGILVRSISKNLQIGTSPSIQKFLSTLSKLENSTEAAYAYSYAFNLYAKGGYAEQAEVYFQEMRSAWMCIDILPERVEVGFDIVNILSEHGLTEATMFYNLVSETRRTHPLANWSMFELYINLLNLSNRTVLALRNEREFEKRLNELVNNIEQIPSVSVRAKGYGDLALRMYLQGLGARAENLFETRIFTLIENCHNVAARKNVLQELAPAIFRVQPTYFNQVINEMGYERDQVIFDVILRVIANKGLYEPINTEEPTYKTTNTVANEVCGLIEQLSIDDLIYASIRIFVSSIVDNAPTRYEPYRENSRFGEPAAVAIAKRLMEVIKKLPDVRNIRHEGFKIACKAQICRLRDATLQRKDYWKAEIPTWKDLINDAKEIPNLTDRVTVYCWIANIVKSTDVNIASSLLSEAQNIVYQIPNVTDRVDSMKGIAETWNKLDEIQSAKYLLTEAMKILDGLSWNETRDESAGLILQAAHTVDPAFASSLTSIIDNPSVQRRLQDQVYSKDLYKFPEKVGSKNEPIDYELITSTAYDIVRAINNNSYHTIPDAAMARWLKLGAELPFYESFPIRLVEVLNTQTENDLSVIYYNLIDSMRLIGTISTILFPYDKSAIDNNVPKHMRVIPIQTFGELSEYIKLWIDKVTELKNIHIFDAEFSYLDLELIEKYITNIPIMIFTTWSAQDLPVRDSSFKELFRNALKDLTDQEPYDIQITLLETEKATSPLENRFYIVNERSGLELIPHRSYFERAFIHIRELSTDEAIALAQENKNRYLLDPVREYDGHKVYRDILAVN